MNTPIFSLDAARRAKRDLEASKFRGSGGGDGPTDNDMEKRVSALEKALEKIDNKLDKLGEQGHALDLKLASIDGKMDGKASAEKVGEISGRVSDLPSKWFVGTTAIAVLFGASALISAVLVYLEKFGHRSACIKPVLVHALAVRAHHRASSVAIQPIREPFPLLGVL